MLAASQRRQKLREALDQIRARITTEVADADLFEIKTTKRRGVDAMQSFKECASAQRFLKVLNAPTPSQKSLMLMQTHLENLSKQLRS